MDERPSPWPSGRPTQERSLPYSETIQSILCNCLSRPLGFRTARFSPQSQRPPTQRTPRWSRKIPVIESTLLQHEGKLDQLCHRVLSCEENIEVSVQLFEKQRTVIQQMQHQLQDDLEAKPLAELQKQFVGLEDAVHELQQRFHAGSDLPGQVPELQGLHNPVAMPPSPPLTPTISPRRLPSPDQGCDWFKKGINAGWRQSSPSPVSEHSRHFQGAAAVESTEDVNFCRTAPSIDITLGNKAAESEPNSVVATPSKTPGRDACLESPNATDGRSQLAEDDEPVHPSYDQILRRRFVLQLRRVLAQSNEKLASATSPSDSVPLDHRADGVPAVPKDPDIAVCGVDTEQLQIRRPISLAELRFKGAGQVKDLVFEVERQLRQSGCEELWAGGEAAADWDGARKVDKRTRELVVGKLRWARDVAADKN